MTHSLSASSLVPEPLNDLAMAVNLMAEITGAIHSTVKERLGHEHRRLGHNVEEAMRLAKVEPYIFTDDLARLYSETDAFLYETLTWNRYPTKQKMRKWIIDFLKQHYPAGARILAYGDGLGFDSAGLALAGHRVTYFEVGKRSIAFARQIFERNCVQIEVCNDPRQLAPESFDAVICMDVLEHVPDPPSLVQEIAKSLRSGGHFIVHAPFWYLHRNVSTHLSSNLKYSGDWRKLYAPAGLTPVDAAIAWNPLALVKDAPDIQLAASCRFRLLLGSALLKYSRVWNLPPITILQGITGAERRKLLSSSNYILSS